MQIDRRSFLRGIAAVAAVAALPAAPVPAVGKTVFIGKQYFENCAGDIISQLAKAEGLMEGDLLVIHDCIFITKNDLWIDCGIRNVRMWFVGNYVASHQWLDDMSGQIYNDIKSIHDDLIPGGNEGMKQQGIG